MDELFEQTFPASAEALAGLRTEVRAACQQAGCDEECAGQVVLAVNEACMNIIQHGYAFAEGGRFTLRLAKDDRVVVIHLLDNGRAVLDADLRPRDFDALRPGGLGVSFMRELMDVVSYQPPPPCFTNCLQLRKRIC